MRVPDARAVPANPLGERTRATIWGRKARDPASAFGRDLVPWNPRLASAAPQFAEPVQLDMYPSRAVACLQYMERRVG
jgi:hypothetical protein